MLDNNLHIKTLCFEYIVYRLLKVESPTLESNIVALYTRLRALKLLFLTAAVTADENHQGLLDIFNSFYAMQYGPVEGTVYNAMVKDETTIFDFSNRNTKLKVSHDKINFDEIEGKKQHLDEAIDRLLEINKDIIHYDPYRLVEITHKWISWRVAYSYAKITEHRSVKMSVEEIQKDMKYFF